MSGGLVTNQGAKVMLNRTYKETPDYLAPTQFKIGTGTTDANLTDTDLETPVTIDATAFKDFVVGYPTIDETNFVTTIRCFVASTEANGNEITEFGIVNEDATKKLISRDVFTAISKADTDEIVFIQKDTLDIN